MDEARDDAARPASWPATLLFAVLFLAFTLRWGAAPGIDPDASWAMVLAWAQQQGLRFGQDLVFSYGPLGHLQPGQPYDPAFAANYLCGQLLLGLGYAGVFAAVFRRLGQAERWAFALIALPACRLQADTLLLGCAMLAVVPLARGLQASRRQPATWLLLGLLALQLNALALLKFSLVPLSFALALAGAFALLQQRRTGAAAGWLALWALTMAGLWLGLGQHVADFWLYLQAGFWLTAGYGAGMVLAPQWPAVLAGAGLFVAVAALLWHRGRRALSGDPAAAIWLAYLGFALCLAWRAGFTRADIWHLRNYFALALLIGFAAIALTGGRLLRRGRRLLPVAGVLIAAGAVAAAVAASGTSDVRSLAARAVRQLQPAAVQTRHAASLDDLRTRAALPRLRALIGDARVDLLGNDQAVLLLNGLHYAPRPLFQSYAAYAPALQRRNAAYFLGADAPPFVLFNPATLDRHAPASEDALALLAALQHYRPLAQERGYLLLQRAVPAAAVPQIRVPDLPASAGDDDVVAPDLRAQAAIERMPSEQREVAALQAAKADLSAGLANDLATEAASPAATTPRPETRPSPAQVPTDTTAPWQLVAADAWTDLPASGPPLRLRLRYRLSLAGQLRAALLGEPTLLLETERSDGRRERYRLVRPVAAEGFLLSPALETAANYLDWYCGRADTTLKRLRLRSADGQQYAFAGDMALRLEAVTLTRAQPGAAAVCTDPTGPATPPADVEPSASLPRS